MAREAAQLAQAEIIAGDFLKVPLEPGFDVITMFDVIEHVRDPLAWLVRARELLAPGGLLVIETGDVASAWARLLGRHWYFLDPPQHLWYFTGDGLEALLARAGFRARAAALAQRSLGEPREHRVQAGAAGAALASAQRRDRVRAHEARRQPLPALRRHPAARRGKGST